MAAKVSMSNLKPKRRRSRDMGSSGIVKGKAKIYIGPSPTNSALDEAIHGAGSSFGSSFVKNNLSQMKELQSNKKSRTPPPTMKTKNSPAQSKNARKRWKKLKTVAVAASAFKKSGERRQRTRSEEFEELEKKRRKEGGSSEAKTNGTRRDRLLSDEEISMRARKNWKKAGNLAVAMNRFAKGSATYEQRIKGRAGASATTARKIKSPRISSPVTSPPNNSRNNSRAGTPTSDNNSGRGRANNPAPTSKKEAEILKRSRESIRKNPGPKVLNGAIHGKGVHKVRWSEKLRGLSIITNNVVLGGRDEANNRDLMRKYGVTHVLNVSKQLKNFHPDDFVYLKINCLDADNYNIVADFEPARNFIKQVEDCKGRVLVHCIAGVSRSVCMILMYMMAEHGICLNQIYKHIKKVRPFIKPNEGFRLQMTQFELKYLGYSSVAGPKAGPDWRFYKWNALKKDAKRGGNEGSLKSGDSFCHIL